MEKGLKWTHSKKKWMVPGHEFDYLYTEKCYVLQDIKGADLILMI